MKAQAAALKRDVIDWAKVGFWITVQVLAGYKYVESINLRVELLTAKLEERATDWKEMKDEVRRLADSRVRTDMQLEAQKVLIGRFDELSARLSTLEQLVARQYRTK